MSKMESYLTVVVKMFYPLKKTPLMRPSLFDRLHLKMQKNLRVEKIRKLIPFDLKLR